MWCADEAPGAETADEFDRCDESFCSDDDDGTAAPPPSAERRKKKHRRAPPGRGRSSSDDADECTVPDFVAYKPAYAFAGAASASAPARAKQPAPPPQPTKDPEHAHDDDHDHDNDHVSSAVAEVPRCRHQHHHASPKRAETDHGSTTSRGPQCSQYPHEFCFFCAYEKDPNAESGSAADLYGGLVDLVNSMTRQNKEFPAIVDAVHVAYETQIRPYTDDPDFGASPAWTPASIERHLTFSNQFAPVFDSSVTQVFHSIVAAQNRTLLDAVTGQVIEENRQALMSTLNNYIKWQKFQASRSSTAPGGGKGKR